MLLFVILGHTPLVLLVCLLGLLYLTWVELRDEPLEPQVKLWWYLLVLLTQRARATPRCGSGSRSGAGAPPRVVQPDELHRELEREQVLVARASSPVTRSIRASRWRSVFGWM